MTDERTELIDAIDEAIENAGPLHNDALDDYFQTIDEKNLIEQAQGAINELHAMIRDQVLKHGRIDILEEECLGYGLEPFHEQILAAQNKCRPGKKQMTLAFRGAGKSTVGCVGRCVFEILRNPNIRILIASETQAQADAFLREVREHFEANETFRAIFGDWVGPKWGASEIIVNKRTKIVREGTVTAIGVGGPTVGKHYDLIIGDDCAVEKNSRTENQRERVVTWFYKSLMPTLEPDGRVLINGTRYHPQDLYGYLLKNDPTIVTTIIPILTEDGKSQWPEKWPIDQIIDMKAEYGLPVFETQYQMNTNAMEGKIFSYDSFHFYETLPQSLLKFQGADLAISMKEGNDYFAHCTIGVDLETQKKYIIDIHRGRKKFQEQTDYMLKQFYRHDPMRLGIEANAYQGAQVYTMQDHVGKNRAIPIYTLKDKRTRAMMLAAKCENEELLFHRSQMTLIEELIAMPDGDHDDLFDALDIAHTTASANIKKQRRSEPGLM